MSPRKDHHRIPPWRVQRFRKRRDKMLFGPYSCPRCKTDKLRISIDAEHKKVAVTCECGLEQPVKYVSIYEPVDYYNRFLDQY